MVLVLEDSELVVPHPLFRGRDTLKARYWYQGNYPPRKCLGGYDRPDDDSAWILGLQPREGLFARRVCHKASANQFGAGRVNPGRFFHRAGVHEYTAGFDFINLAIGVLETNEVGSGVNDFHFLLLSAGIRLPAPQGLFRAG
jgi:hypothetical protein